MKENTYVLLLTACIIPIDLRINKLNIERVDPYTRLQDYKVALRYWLNNNDERITGIVFIENSGYDLSSLKAIAKNENIYNKNVEFIQYLEGKKDLEGLHYGYSELEMIDYAFDNSKLVSSSNCVIKVTGRLFFPKLSKLLDRVKNYLVVIDSRDYEFFKIRRHYSVTTMFIVNKNFYMNTLYGIKAKMNLIEFSHMEKIYFYVLKPLFVSIPDQVMIRFPFNVDPVGVGAHKNIKYNSVSKKLLNIFRELFRYLYPRLWI